jgi:hypothetical protein
VDRPALGNPLEAAELGHMKVGVPHVPGVVQEKGDPGMAFDTGHWFDDYLAHALSSGIAHDFSFGSAEP